MEPKPYILFLPKWYPCRTDPLNGIFVKRHGKAISAFIDVVVLYVIVDANLKKGIYERVETIEEGMLTVRYYFKKNITGISILDKLLKLFLYTWCSFLGYNSICKTKASKPLLTHVHVFLRPAVIAYFIKVFNGINFIVTEHWTGYLTARNAYKGTARKYITSFVAKRAAGIVPVSEALRNAMVKHNILSNYFVIPNVVDVDRFINQGSAKDEPATILFVGSMIDEHKNVSGMINVMIELRKKRTDFKFVIIGTGIDEAKIMNTIKVNNLEAYIEFLGYIPNNDLPKYYSVGSFMIMFSQFEIQPTVILEAMACGLPVIAPNIGGISEVINDKNGFVIEPNNAGELEEKICILLDTYKNYNSTDIRNYIVNRFSNEKVGANFYELYLKIANK